MENLAKVLRYVCIAVCVCAVAFFAWHAVRSYPFIVPADSDLGASAMHKVWDAALMGFLALACLLSCIARRVNARLRICAVVATAIVAGLKSFNFDEAG